MHQHIGVFAGERFSASSGDREPSTFLKDLAGLLAGLAFCAAVAFIALATILPELPA